jgi:hypothetical protein
VMATRARDVIGAEVEDDRMTCKNGFNSEGVSKRRISIPYQSLSNISHVRET